MAPAAERPALEAKLREAARALAAELEAAGERLPDVKARRGSAVLPPPPGARRRR